MNVTDGNTAINDFADCWISQVQICTFGSYLLVDTMPHGANLDARILQNAIVGDGNAELNWDINSDSLGKPDSGTRILSPTATRFNVKISCNFFKEPPSVTLVIVLLEKGA